MGEGSLASEIGTDSGTTSLAKLRQMKIFIEKGDSEEKIMMAKALLANGVVSAIETVQADVRHYLKSDEEVALAVVEVARCFGVCTQWTAVYRVLVDFCNWESDIAKFTQRMNILLKEVRLSYGCTYQAIQKPLSANVILRKHYWDWKKYRVPAGDRVFARQLFIAQKLLKLLSIGA